MYSTGEAPWLVIQLFILFCAAALGCNFFGLPLSLACSGSQQHLGRQGEKAVPVLLGSVLCGRSNKLNSTKVLGIYLGMILIPAEFLEVLAVGL